VRYWGKIATIKQIDQLMQASDKAVLCKNGSAGRHSQLRGTSKSRFFTRRWLVSYDGRTAAVKLVFDYRYGSGDVTIANDQAWWVAWVIPRLAAIMARLKPSSVFGTREEWGETLGKGLFGRKR
jgi:hypothetical protein